MSVTPVQRGSCAIARGVPGNQFTQAGSRRPATTSPSRIPHRSAVLPLRNAKHPELVRSPRPESLLGSSVTMRASLACPRTRRISPCANASRPDAPQLPHAPGRFPPPAPVTGCSTAARVHLPGVERAIPPEHELDRPASDSAPLDARPRPLHTLPPAALQASLVRRLASMIFWYRLDGAFTRRRRWRHSRAIPDDLLSCGGAASM